MYGVEAFSVRSLKKNLLCCLSYICTLSQSKSTEQGKSDVNLEIDSNDLAIAGQTRTSETGMLLNKEANDINLW